jgi:metal-responsive CopG/Arc/MetJ family transcriptional regulator
MKTVQMTLDEELVAEVDRAVERLGTTRSAFARQALRQALEQQHRQGYARQPVKQGEFSLLES